MTLPLPLLLGVLACVSTSAVVGEPEARPGDGDGGGAPDPDDGGGGTTVEHVGGDSGPAVEPCYAQVPVLLIDTDGVNIGDAEKTPGTLTLIRDHNGSLDDLATAPIDALWPIGIELHGSSSVGYPKLPYRLECRDAKGQETGCGLLDLPSASDWILHAPYSDKTLVRNAYAYVQAREVAAASGGGDGFPTDDWQPRSALVELVVNGQYGGVYLLVERAQRDDDRLDLNRPADSATEGDITGGYIVKIDAGRSEGWLTAAGTIIDYHQPKADTITTEQDAYLRGWFDGFEAAMAADTWQDPTLGYPNLINQAGWVDFILQNELANNVDAYRLSTYLSKDSELVDTRLHVGPVWDFDRAYGDVNYCDCWNTYGWVTDELTTCGYAYQYPFWWLSLLGDRAMQDALRCRWDSLRADVLSDDSISLRLDALVAQLDLAQPRDNARWGTIGVYVDPNYYVGPTYEAEVEFLRSWTIARAAWMDDNLPGTCE